MKEAEVRLMFGHNPEGGVDTQDVAEITTLYEDLLRRCLNDEFGITSKALRADIEAALAVIGKHPSERRQPTQPDVRREAELSSNFEVVRRPHGECWKHKTQDFWIVAYESPKPRGKPCFKAYRAIEGCDQRDPWTVNNRCVGEFRTLAEAMVHADA